MIHRLSIYMEFIGNLPIAKTITAQKDNLGTPACAASVAAGRLDMLLLAFMTSDNLFQYLPLSQADRQSTGFFIISRHPILHREMVDGQGMPEI